jgi:mono/diheme cytochrome c family protein
MAIQLQDKYRGDAVQAKLLRALVACGVLLLGGLAVAKSSRNDKAKERVPINSIQGPVLFKAYCASCHGIGGKGDGPMAMSLKVKPADLTRIAERNGGVFPLMRIEKIISGEEQRPYGHGTSEMPVWGPIFSYVEVDRDLGRVRIDNLGRYLRDIQVK